MGVHLCRVYECDMYGHYLLAQNGKVLFSLSYGQTHTMDETCKDNIYSFSVSSFLPFGKSVLVHFELIDWMIRLGLGWCSLRSLRNLRRALSTPPTPSS